MSKVTEVLVWAQFLCFRITSWDLLPLCPPVVSVWPCRHRKQLEER